MEKIIILFVISYCLIATGCNYYTIDGLKKSIIKKQPHLISMFQTLKIVSFIPILNLFYLVCIIEDTLKNKQ